MSKKGLKSAVPRLAVGLVVGSLAGVHSDVVSETTAATVFDIGLQSTLAVDNWIKDAWLRVGLSELRDADATRSNIML